MNILTPNQQLYFSLGLFFLFVALLAVAFVLTYAKLASIQKMFGPVTPFWRRTIAELSAVMRHPHEEALEQDALMGEFLDELERWPDAPMADERMDRLMVLLAERVTSKAAWLRPKESNAAAAFLLFIDSARAEAESKVMLTGIQLVGSLAPLGQSLEDAHERQATV